MEMNVGLSRIIPSRWQPRKMFDADELYNLACSIRDQGLINAVLVFQHRGGYELIAGERRTRAACALSLSVLIETHSLADWCGRLAAVGLAGMGEEERAALAGEPGATIRASVRPADDMAALHLLAVTENLNRAELTPVEEAHAYHGLLTAYGWTQRELAGRLNKSQGYIAQRLALLGLKETAVTALNTRVIGMSHARALAAIPEAIQEAATNYVVRAIAREDSPATTRQVENQLRALVEFVQPGRWVPQGETVYTAQQRNRLAVIEMLMRGPQAEERIAKNLEGLLNHKNNYETKNLLTAQPLTIVKDDDYYASVTNALGMRTQDAWQNHSLTAGKLCSTCVFENARPKVIINGLSVYCPRWRDASVETCEGWIGAGVPVVIHNHDYEINDILIKAGAYREGLPHTDSVAAYVTAYDAAVSGRMAREAQRQQNLVDGPRRAIAEFWAWQQTLPTAALEHSQAHWCELCRHYEPLNGDAPCRFALNPLKGNEMGSAPRAPIFGILVGREGLLLPRCELFTLPSGRLPYVYERPGFSAGQGERERRQFMRLFKAIKHGERMGWWHSALWRGPLAWLCADVHNYDFEGTLAYLYKRWDEIGDGGMATLLDALWCELEASRNGYAATLELVNLRDGAFEEWAALRFDNRAKPQASWPQNWFKPWESGTAI